MTDHTEQLRALLLAGIVALSVVAGGVAFAGNTVAAKHHGLTATDGAGGNASALIAGFDAQRPDGEESGDDTLRVEATNESFPTEFDGELTLPDSDVTFGDDQGPEDIELVVVGERGDTTSAADSDGIEVTHVGSDRVAFEVANDGLLKSQPVAVEIRNLRFDAADTETASLQWTVDGETAAYDLRVEPFEPELTATDDSGGFAAAVTAGAENQTLVGAATGATGDPASTVVLRGNESELPTQFEATLSVEGTGIEFHERNNGDYSVSSSSGRAYVPSDGVSSTELTVEVGDFEGPSGDAAIVSIDGVTVDVPPDADTENVTWEINGRTDSYELLPDRLDARFAADAAVPRGLDGAPTDGATVEITGQNAFTSGLHDADEDILVEIPAAHRENLSFDTSAATSATIESGGDLMAGSANVSVERHRLVVSVDRDINDSETVTLSNVRFNTSGFDGPADSEAADFTSALTVVTTPVDSGGFDSVEVDTDNALEVDTPAVAVTGNTTRLESGHERTNGTAEVGVRIEDTTGRAVAPGTDMVVGLEGDSGIDFDTNQSVAVGGALSGAAEASVGADTIVISVDDNASATAAGDVVTIEAADGDGLRFDTTDASDGESVGFRVTTNAGDVPVVQSTDTVATTGNDTDSGDGGSGDDGSDDDGSGDGGSGDDGSGDDGNTDDGSGDSGGQDGDESGDESGGGDETDQDGDESGGNESDGGDGDGTDETTGGTGGGGGGGGGAPTTQPSDDEGAANNTSDDESGNGTSGGDTTEGTDTEAPPGAVAAATRAIDDAAPERDGVTVGFENVTLDRITFVEGAAGEATVVEMEDLPEGVSETPGDLLSVLDITVPGNLSDDPATVRFTLTESDLESVGAAPESIRLGHYTDGGWDIHQPELVATEGGEYVYESEVPGFSLYAVYAGDAQATEAPAEGEDGDGEDDPVGETSSLVSSPVTTALGFVGLLALVVSIAGARMYRRNDSL